MAAGGSHFKGAFHVLSTLYVGKVEVEVVLGGGGFSPGVDDGGGQLPVAVEEVDHLFDVVDPVDVQPVDDGGLSHVGTGHDESVEPLGPSQYGNGQRAAYGEYRAVEREFTHNHVAAEFLGRNLFGGGQDTDGQRQVVGRTLFSQVGRCEVDNELAVRKFVAVVLQGRAYAFVALFYGGVGQPYHVEVNALRTVYFDGYGQGVDALHGCSENFDQHLAFCFICFFFLFCSFLYPLPLLESTSFAACPCCISASRIFLCALTLRLLPPVVPVFPVLCAPSLFLSPPQLVSGS